MKIEEKIKLLKTELESLNKAILESESAFNFSMKIAEIFKSVDLSIDKDRDVFIKMAKESYATELDLLRTKINSIRKFSVETADFLDNRVNEYELATRNFMETLANFNKSVVTEETGLKYLELFLMFLTSYNKLHDMVNMSRNCIRDTLKRLEDFTFKD